MLSDVDMVFKCGSVEWGGPRQKHVTSSHRGPQQGPPGALFAKGRLATPLNYMSESEA